MRKETIHPTSQVVLSPIYPLVSQLMPVPISTDATPELFPPLTRAQVDAARTSAWEELFHDVTAPVTIVDLQVLGEREAFLEVSGERSRGERRSEGLSVGGELEAPKIKIGSHLSDVVLQAHTQWLDGESIFLPEDSGSAPPAEGAPIYRLPGVNAAIRSAVAEYGAVFPKLNWTAPRDAAFLLPQGDGPMHCTSPADVYLLLKGSDFVAHGVGARAYEGASDAYDGTAEDAGVGAHEHQVPRLELVLKKYTPVNPAREVRCFVRDNVLLGELTG